jgi:hypothetical protein
MRRPIMGEIRYTDRDLNAARGFGEATSYLPAYLALGNGRHTPLLLTRQQIEAARMRAISQPEDVPPRAGYLLRVWDALWSFA